MSKGQITIQDLSVKCDQFKRHLCDRYFTHSYVCIHTFNLGFFWRDPAPSACIIVHIGASSISSDGSDGGRVILISADIGFFCFHSPCNHSSCLFLFHPSKKTKKRKKNCGLSDSRVQLSLLCANLAEIVLRGDSALIRSTSACCALHGVCHVVCVCVCVCV